MAIRKKRAMSALSTSCPHLYRSGSQSREGVHLQRAGHPLNLTKTITHRSVQSLISEMVLDHGMLTVKTSLIQPPLLERAFSTLLPRTVLGRRNSYSFRTEVQTFNCSLSRSWRLLHPVGPEYSGPRGSLTVAID